MLKNAVAIRELEEEEEEAGKLLHSVSHCVKRVLLIMSSRNEASESGEEAIANQQIIL
jgi:hypothetical protein